MISFTLSNGDQYNIEYAIFDYNGTLAENGLLSEEIKDLLGQLAERVNVTVVTADTFGLAHAQLKSVHGVKLHVIKAGDESAQKRDFLRLCGKNNTICFGNGANDIAMFDEACLAVGVIGAEGAYQPTLAKAHIIVTNPRDAILLLLKPKRMVATLRC